MPYVIIDEAVSPGYTNLLTLLAYFALFYRMLMELAGKTASKRNRKESKELFQGFLICQAFYTCMFFIDV